MRARRRRARGAEEVAAEQRKDPVFGLAPRRSISYRNMVGHKLGTRLCECRHGSDVGGENEGLGEGTVACDVEETVVYMTEGIECWKLELGHDLEQGFFPAGH